MSSTIPHYQPWPALPYEQFQATGYLLHMFCQAMGKLKLMTPFEPHWANVALWISSQGVSTGPIAYGPGVFSVEIDLLHHQVICVTSWNKSAHFSLQPTSVAELTGTLFQTLRKMDIDVKVNLMPQEVAHPIAFDKDTVKRLYNAELANAWWRILVSSLRVMERYHARFTGITPPIGLMWGTFDLRDARYKGTHVPTTGANADYIRRNAMDDAQVETGWWSGNDQYTRPAYFSFVYPQPQGIETAKIKPAAAHWDAKLGEFILDYDDLRQSKDPEGDLLAFMESTYKVEAECAGWDPELIGSGHPV